MILEVRVRGIFPIIFTECVRKTVTPGTASDLCDFSRSRIRP